MSILIFTLKKAMKHYVVIAVGLLFSVHAFAQLPYFAGVTEKNKMYGYTSVKCRPGINHLETYTTFQYGLGADFATGIDLYTGPHCAYWGALVRYGRTINKWINIGAQITPSFNLNDSFRFSYLTNALYTNGALTKDSRLFWCSNTWWVVKNGADNTFYNYEYLGYTVPFKKEGHSITPMAGINHSWLFDQKINITAGLYYTFRKWSFYVWGDKFLEKHPRFIVGIEFTL